MTSDGKPYAPIRYKQIVKECYLISKNLNTSYTDLLSVTPIERSYMLEFLAEEAKKSQEMIEQQRNKK